MGDLLHYGDASVKFFVDVCEDLENSSGLNVIKLSQTLCTGLTK